MSNSKNTLIMGAVGLFLGIIATMFISLSAIGPVEQPNHIYSYLTIAFLTLTFGLWGSQMKRNPSEKIELPIRFIRIALIVAWIIIFYFKLK